MTSPFERRYQVFISSTYTDLQDERKAVMQSILEMDCFPAGMELFPAADESAWRFIERAIRESDFYLVVIGARYGSRDESGLSFTEREYDLAVELKKPVLAFLHGEPGKIAQEKADLKEQDRIALAEFRAKVERRLCDHWNNPDQLRARVMAGLTNLRKSYPQGGWVRAGEFAVPELERDLERTRRELAEAKALLRDRERARGPMDSDPESVRNSVDWAEDAKMVVSVAIPEAKARVVNGRTLPGHPARVEAMVQSANWSTLFKHLGPRLAERNQETSSLGKLLRDQVALPQEGAQRGRPGHSYSVPTIELDRLLWQLRFFGLIQLEQGMWRLTKAGWTELEKLLVAPPAPSEEG